MEGREKKQLITDLQRTMYENTWKVAYSIYHHDTNSVNTGLLNLYFVPLLCFQYGLFHSSNIDYLMIKTDQAADESGVYSLKSLTSWNYWDKLAVLKDTEITFGFIHFISSKLIVNSISLKELCWLKLPQNLVQIATEVSPEIKLKNRGLG